MDNVLVGDVWVMNGQSNMAFALKAEAAAALKTLLEASAAKS